MTHGHRHPRTPTYNSWRKMLERCYNPNDGRYARGDRYKDYGGRGITVCDRWRGESGFINFLADMGLRPEGCTLDRIDVDGPYAPQNCRWATPSEQRTNQRPASPAHEPWL